MLSIFSIRIKKMTIGTDKEKKNSFTWEEKKINSETT